jgi:hypothetical protein
MNKCIALFFLILLPSCLIEAEAPPRSRVYDCVTYMYCDGEEYYEEYSVCTGASGALYEEDSFYDYCADYGYYNCWNYECAADCYNTGLTCH